MEIRCDHAAAPFDRASIEMERTWGIDQLVSLVSPTTAEKYGRAMAHMNAMINAENAPEVAAAAINCMRGLAAMDAEARAVGATPLPPEVFEYEQDGHHFAIIRDTSKWQMAEDRLPGATIYTMREVANALAASRNVVAAVKDAFPGAQVVAIRQRTDLEKSLNDEIPF